LRRWSGFNPAGAGFWGRGISQSLSSHERVIDLGEPGTAGNNFRHGGRLSGVRHQSPTLGGFHGDLFTVDEIGISYEIKKNPHS